MAEISVDIGGRSYQVACRDGGEDQLRKVAAMVDERAASITKAVGNVTELRQLLMVSLVLADELSELREANAAAGASAGSDADKAEINDTRDVEMVEKLVERAEALAERLEQMATNT